MIVSEIIYLILLFFGTYYICFHLVHWLENRNKFKGSVKPIKDKDLPKISLIVPAYNEGNVIEKTLKKLKKISYPKNKLEIIVVDDGSNDKTYEIAKRFESRHIRVFTKPNSGKADSLNFGIKKSKNDFVAVMDADSYLGKNALRNCMKYFEEENVAAVTSHVLVGRKKTFWEKMQGIELMLTSVMRKSQEFANVIWCTPGPLSVYRKKVLVKLKGFDKENLTEDVEISWRILRHGYKIKMAFDAIVYSLYPETFKKWWRQRTRWNIGGFQTLFKHLDAFGSKTYGVGGFILPIQVLGYAAAFVGLTIFIYLGGIAVFNFLSYFFKSIFLGLNPFARLELAFYPNILFIYGSIVFILGLFWLRITFKQHGWKFNFLDLVKYMSVYSFFYPFISINGAYKYIRKDRRWLTK